LLPCFEENVIDLAPLQQPTVDLSFYGSLSASLFGNRIELLNHLIRNTPIEIWGEMPKFLKRPWLVEPFLRQFRLWRLWSCQRRHPPVFGLEMFSLLKRSKMTFNIHVDAARGMAGNIRMFEATGMGTLLVTEAAPNLAELFEPDREVVTYTSKDEAVEKILYLLEHEAERHKIAFAGQQRTTKQHTAAKRAEEFLDLIHKHLA
jgi:spore maturation protein CgeB